VLDILPPYRLTDVLDQPLKDPELTIREHDRRVVPAHDAIFAIDLEIGDANASVHGTTNGSSREELKAGSELRDESRPLYEVARARIHSIENGVPDGTRAYEKDGCVHSGRPQPTDLPSSIGPQGLVNAEEHHKAAAELAELLCFGAGGWPRLQAAALYELPELRITLNDLPEE